MNALLDRMQFRADPLADATIADILGLWSQPVPNTPAAQPMLATNWQPHWQKLATVNRMFEQWPDNRSLASWRAAGSGLAPEMGAPLEHFVDTAQRLPDWADADKLERAETLFMEYGALSVTMLFCSSLPECYVIPDLAAVLHVTGQLEKHTSYRIRATGAMIFPVMMRGGLTAPDGGGVAQICKVRLIHATIRNLILRGSPEAAAADAGAVPTMPAMAGANNLHQALFAHGWKTAEEGLPCNQEELAYTLLTFSYVFLRSMRKLGLALSRADEEAYLHTWNVAGHILGIERELMADTMEAAEKLFARMQARGRADRRLRPEATDPRPALGTALMQSMEQVIPLGAVKPFPVLLTRFLCGADSSQDLGLNGRTSWISRLLFTTCMLAARMVDSLVRLVYPGFSIIRFITRVLGYHLISKLLMDQTRPLNLPLHLRSRVETMMDCWGTDPKAPAWMNTLEDRVTVNGSWKTSKP